MGMSTPKVQSTPPPANKPTSADYSQTGPGSMTSGKGAAYAGTLLTNPSADLTQTTNKSSGGLLGG